MAAKKKAVAKKKEPAAEMKIERLKRGSLDLCLLGVSPLMMKSISMKVMQSLFLPPPPKTAGTKKTTLKHDPYLEFLDAAHTHEEKETLLCMPSRVFKKALCAVATDIPDSPARAQLNRTIWVPDETVSVYGIPEIDLREVRMADQKRTPDVRSRPLLKKWAARVTVQFVPRLATAESLVNLMANAGLINGIGEDRPQKGGGGYGCWEVVNEDNKEFQRIVKECGREAQQKAMDDPEPSNAETAKLLSWFFLEARSREFEATEYPKIEKLIGPRRGSKAA